jgi:ABC-type uncharacterized transport system permease subunit
VFVDPNVLRFNQISLVTLIVIAALTNTPALVAILGAILLAGSFNPKLALFKNLYSSLVRPALRLAVNRVPDDPRAHNFAQTLGGIFLIVATLAFLVGSNLVGWTLAALVASLALVNLTTQFCVGCFLYFQLRMLQHRFGQIKRA